MNQTPFILIVLLAIHLFCSGLSTAEDKLHIKHNEAVEYARQGKMRKALQLFETLLKESPGNKELLYDYALTLSWADKCNDAVTLYERLNSKGPTYMRKGIAKCYRNLKMFRQSADVYQQILKKDPNNHDALSGLAYVYTDMGEKEKAIGSARQLQKIRPDGLDDLFVKAYIFETDGQTLKALDLYQAILLKDPNNTRAITMKIKALTSIGAHALALESADKHKSKLEPEKFNLLNNNIAARQIRWSRLIEPPSPEQEWLETDAAIETLTEILANDSSNIRARFDLIGAYRDRRYFDKALAEYEKLQKKSVEIPIWVKKVIADVLREKKKSKKALDLLDEILKEKPGDYQSSLQRYYVLINLNKYDEAGATLEQLINTNKNKERKLELAIIKRWHIAYQGDTVAAEKEFKTLFSEAAFNTSIHSGIAHTYLWRGWPRKAEDEFKWILSNDPQYVNVRVGYTNTLMDLGKYRVAQAQLYQMQRSDAQNPNVARLSKRWERHNSEGIEIDSSFSREDQGGEDFRIDMSLNSRPIHYDYRIYVNLLRHHASADANSHTYSRLGTGLFYNGGAYFSLSQEFTFDINANDDSGSITSVTAHPDDHWTISAAHNSFSVDLPVRARVHRITGVSSEIYTTYEPDSASAISIGFNRSRFSDQNQRDYYSLEYRHQIVRKTLYRNYTEVYLSSSNNSKKDRPYFNPSSDRSYSVTNINEWDYFGFSGRKLTQTLSVTLGQYNQENYSSGVTGQLKLAHRWEISPDEELVYDVSLNRWFFDGVAEHEPAFHFALVFIF